MNRRIDEYSLRSSYPDEIKRDCLKMYVNSIWDRGIEGVNGIHHTIIISWVKQVEVLLLPAYDSETMFETGELDELETFVGSKNKFWLWTAINHFQAGVLVWVLYDHNAKTFASFWNVLLLLLCHR